MSEQLVTAYEFGPFRIDVARRQMMREGLPVSLTSKTFDTLLALVERRHQVVSKDELMNTLWPDTIVEENNLTQQISMLRKVLGERAGEHRYVLTLPGRGYSFIAEISEVGIREPDLIVEQHTRSRITVDVEDEGEVETSLVEEKIKHLPERSHPLRRWRSSRPVIFYICAVLAALIVALVLKLSFSSQQPPPLPNDANRSIAVLPFKSLNRDPADDYLGTGMSDTLIAKLSNINQISVRPTSTVIKYAGQEQDAQAIGRELHVDSVLEGTVQQAGGRIRVTVQLVNVRDRAPLWAQSFDEKLTDIFAVQDSISEQVAKALMVKLNVAERQQLRERETANVEAYQEYLKGRYFWNKRDEEGLKKSLEHFRQAIKLDPAYGRAYAGLADAFTLIAHYRIKPFTPDDSYQEARDAATKALDINEKSAEAHTSLAFIKTYYDRDEAGAEQEFKRAIELNSDYATAHHWYSEYLLSHGREAEAMTEIRRAQELDPLSPVINTTLSERFYLARRYDEAIGQIGKTLEFAPDFGPAHFTLGLAYEQKGMFQEAIFELRKAQDSSQKSSYIRASLGHAYALAGQKGEAHKILADMLAQKEPEPYAVAIIYQGLGEKQQTLNWLKRLKDEKDDMRILLKLDPRLDDLRADPKFQELM